MWCVVSAHDDGMQETTTNTQPWPSAFDVCARNIKLLKVHSPDVPTVYIFEKPSSHGAVKASGANMPMQVKMATDKNAAAPSAGFIAFCFAASSVPVAAQRWPTLRPTLPVREIFKTVGFLDLPSGTEPSKGQTPTA